MSFVFHHRSSKGEAQPVNETKPAKEKRKIIEEDEDYENELNEESDNSDDKDYDGKD